MFGWSEGTIAFYVLLCYTIYIKGFCIEKGKNRKNQRKCKMLKNPYVSRAFGHLFDLVRLVKHSA
jgi:hypothetical protein